MRITNTILAALILLPSFVFGQNIITFIKFEKAPNFIQTPGYETYQIEVRPGYKDGAFRFGFSGTDSTGTKISRSTPLIKLDMKVHKKNYKMPDGKEEWDYETEIISNDTYSDTNFDIGKCPDTKRLTVLVSVPENGRYKLLVWNEYELLEEWELM